VDNSAPQSFSEFVAALRTASYVKYSWLPNAAVSSKEAVEEMRAYLLDYYGDTVVEASHRDDDGQIANRADRPDYVPVRDRHSLRSAVL
jgi:hypothetical protein